MAKFTVSKQSTLVATDTPPKSPETGFDLHSVSIKGSHKIQKLWMTSDE